jgi:hypothetical protein
VSDGINHSRGRERDEKLVNDNLHRRIDYYEGRIVYWQRRALRAEGKTVPSAWSIRQALLWAGIR